jgi:hypothetical protein
MNDFSDLLKHAVAYDDNMRPLAVDVQDGMLLVTLQDGRLIGTPLEWYPKLVAATPEQLARVELSTFGLHWEELDEDLGIEGMLLGIRPKPAQPQRG